MPQRNFVVNEILYQMSAWAHMTKKTEEKKFVKFRAPVEWERRIQWAMYCNGLSSQQDLMAAALESWLRENEKKNGEPVTPGIAPKSKLKAG